jgi:hypothetical protein
MPRYLIVAIDLGGYTYLEKETTFGTGRRLSTIFP